MGAAIGFLFRVAGSSSSASAKMASNSGFLAIEDFFE